MGRWITKNGAHVWIESGSLLDALDEKYNSSESKFIGKVSKTFENYESLGYIKINKSVYKRIADIIGTYPKKYKVGQHVINVDNVIYLVNVERRDYFGVYDYCSTDKFDELIDLYSSI